jgi:hypothetical protein
MLRAAMALLSTLQIGARIRESFERSLPAGRRHRRRNGIARRRSGIRPDRGLSRARLDLSVRCGRGGGFGFDRRLFGLSRALFIRDVG